MAARGLRQREAKYWKLRGDVAPADIEAAVKTRRNKGAETGQSGPALRAPLDGKHRLLLAVFDVLEVLGRDASWRGTGDQPV